MFSTRRAIREIPNSCISLSCACARSLAAYSARKLLREDSSDPITSFSFCQTPGLIYASVFCAFMDNKLMDQSSTLLPLFRSFSLFFFLSFCLSLLCNFRNFSKLTGRRVRRWNLLLSDAIDGGIEMNRSRVRHANRRKKVNSRLSASLRYSS